MLTTKRFSIVVAGLAAAAAVGVTATAVVASGDSAPSGPSGVHLTPLSQGTIPGKVRANTAGIQIRTKGPRDMLVTAITVDPNGGSFGWHTHPGPVLVAVAKGTLTVYSAHSGRCVRETIPAGKAFIEPGGDVHLGRNEGTEPLELNAVFLGPVGTKDYLVPTQEPKGCNV